MLAPQTIRKVQEMNQVFISSKEPTADIRIWRHAQPQDRPLLLGEAVWIDQNHGLPLFGVDAVIQGRTVVSFDYPKAVWMRMSEFEGRDWSFKEEYRHFLNAWKIDDDHYILTCSTGYEGYSVSLQKVEPTKGLVTVVTFGQ